MRPPQLSPSKGIPSQEGPFHAWPPAYPLQGILLVSTVCDARLGPASSAGGGVGVGVVAQGLRADLGSMFLPHRAPLGPSASDPHILGGCEGRSAARAWWPWLLLTPACFQVSCSEGALRTHPLGVWSCRKVPLSPPAVSS